MLALLSAALGAADIPSARAEDSIWSALVLGTNEEHPKAACPELEKYWDKLKNVFGYNQFELLGQHMVNGLGDHWLIPRKDFLLHVNSQKAEKPGFFNMKLDLYQEKKLLAQMEARVSGQNLLFIRGPDYGNGRIIIILMVK